MEEGNELATLLKKGQMAHFAGFELPLEYSKLCQDNLWKVNSHSG